MRGLGQRPVTRIAGGRLESVTMLGGGQVRLVGWSLANSANERGGIRIYSDSNVVLDVNTDRPRPDVQRIAPGAPSLVGFDVTVNAGAGHRLLCVWGVDRRTNGLGLIDAREVDVP